MQRQYNHVGQKTLAAVVHSLFPNYSIYHVLPLLYPFSFFDVCKYILKNAKKEVQIISPFTQRYLEVDIWIPELRIGFEYQVCSTREGRGL